MNHPYIQTVGKPRYRLPGERRALPVWVLWLFWGLIDLALLWLLIRWATA